MSTPEKYAEYEELDRQRKRMLAQCYTNSEIPMDADHGKWIEFRKQWEQLVKSLQPGAAHGSEHAAGQLQTLPLTSPVGWPRSTIPNQVPNTMMELFLGAAAHVSSKACLSQGYCPELTAVRDLGCAGPSSSIPPMHAGDGPLACQRYLLQVLPC